MLMSGGLYSNFWGGMENYYYQRTEEYVEIVEFRKIGCFPVPLISAAVLMDLRFREIPGFDRFNVSIPEDDIILFAENAKRLNMTMEVCNDLEYGYILAPLDTTMTLQHDYEQMVNLRAEVASVCIIRRLIESFENNVWKVFLLIIFAFANFLAYWYPPLQAPPVLENYVPADMPASTIGFDKIYMINLKRRMDRLVRMENVMRLLGIDYDYVEAVDGL